MRFDTVANGMVGVLTEQLYLTVLDVHCLVALGAAEE